MPITMERFNDLLREHEACLALIRQAKQMIEDVMRVTEYDDGQTKAQAFALVRNFLDDLAKAPDALAKIERQHYRSTIKRTLNVRQRMRDARRASGITERMLPSDDVAEVLADMIAAKEYRRLNTAPRGADGRPLEDPDNTAHSTQSAKATTRAAAPAKKRSVVYDPEQPTDEDTQAEFDSTLGESHATLTQEEIAAQVHAAHLKGMLAPPKEPRMGLSPIEHELTKKFTSK